MKSYDFAANLKYSFLQSYLDVSFVCISSLKMVIHLTIQYAKLLPLCGLNHLNVWFNTEPVAEVNILHDTDECEPPTIYFLFENVRLL